MNAKLLKLAKMILKLSQTETDKGILVAESELAEGVEVFVEGEDGELTNAPDGEYVTETTIITVSDGKVVEIKEKEVKEEETTEEETVVEAEEVTEPDPEQVDETEMLKATIAELEATIEALKAEIAEKDEKIAQLEEQAREKEEKAKEEFNEQKPAFKETQEKTVMSLAEAAKSVYNSYGR